MEPEPTLHPRELAVREFLSVWIAMFAKALDRGKKRQDEA